LFTAVQGHRTGLLGKYRLADKLLIQLSGIAKRSRKAAKKTLSHEMPYAACNSLADCNTSWPTIAGNNSGEQSPRGFEFKKLYANLVHSRPSDFGNSWPKALGR
jgi:hypothetical protein